MDNDPPRPRCDGCGRRIVPPSVPWSVDGRVWHLACLAEHDRAEHDDALPEVNRPHRDSDPPVFGGPTAT